MQTATMWNSDGGEVAAARKRKADESSLSSDSDRFTKRFNLLNLGPNANGYGEHRNSNYYIPVSSRSPSPAAGKTKAVIARVNGEDGLMEVDDTRDRVYIHNLDEELADIESDEEKLIFLPDIEKRFTKIPKHVLMVGRDEDIEGQELVLYGVPKSLTVEEGHDSVRRAIIESRQRSREKAAEDARHLDMNCKYEQGNEEPTEMAHGYTSGYVLGEVEDDEDLAQDADPDAMDMD